MNGDWNLVLQWADGFSGGGDCNRFADLPLLDPIQIAIIGEASRINDVRELYNLLHKHISSIGSLTPQLNCGGPRTLHCMARDELECRSILVALLTDQQISNELSTTMNDWLIRRPHNSFVVPVLPINADPSVVLPGALNEWIILRDAGILDELVPDVLRVANIGSDEFRLFISYRRADSQALADQLFEEFSRAGFSVFHDHFCGLPGRMFPPILAENLLDKGLVVVLESPNVSLSKWTMSEVQIAQNFRLGLTALEMPGGQVFGAIPNKDRYDATSGSKWNDGLGNANSSTLVAPKDFVDFVRSRYAEQVLRRRVFLETILGVALAGEGLTSSRERNGTHRISHNREYVVGLSSRPPRLNDFRRVCDIARPTAAQPIAAQQVSVGPIGHLPPQHQSDVAWLAAQLTLATHDEAQITKLAQNIQLNRSMP